MTPAEAKVLADAYLTELRGVPCAAFDWSAREARTHWRFFWNTVAAIEGRGTSLKGVDPVAVDKRSGVVLLDPKRASFATALNAVFPSPPPGRVESTEQAAAIAQAWLDATMEHWSSITTSRELTYGWAFFWNSDAWIRTGDPIHGLAGNGALIVLSATGALHALGTATPFEEQLRGFEREILGRH